MSFHPTGGRTAATAASANQAVASLWNPHGTARVYLTFLELCTTGAVAQSFALQRISARGTATTTVTPNADNAYDRDVANVAGMVLDVAYSVQPTLVAAVLWRWNIPNVAGSGFMKQFPGRGISIPPGTGLCLVGVTASVPIADVNVLFED
jgi:hypothetical protein